jgi:hypothetical protein
MKLLKTILITFSIVTLMILLIFGISWMAEHAVLALIWGIVALLIASLSFVIGCVVYENLK